MKVCAPTDVIEEQVESGVTVAATRDPPQQASNANLPPAPTGANVNLSHANANEGTKIQH